MYTRLESKVSTANAHLHHTLTAPKLMRNSSFRPAYSPSHLQPVGCLIRPLSLSNLVRPVLQGNSP